jgi:hypothetical protein
VVIKADEEVIWNIAKKKMSPTGASLVFGAMSAADLCLLLQIARHK